jgi:DNA-binding IclR family transcriptional regulator
MKLARVSLLPTVGAADGSELDQNTTGARQVVPAVDRAMRILTLLESFPQRTFTVSDIAHALKIPKSTSFNICGALAEGQMLRRSHDGFQLGRRLVQLGSAYVSSFNLVGEFYEVCRAIPADLQATVQLAILDEGFNALYLGFQDCNSGLRLGLGGGIGRRVPANCTACGKALLAALTPAELDRRLPKGNQLPRMTRKSMTNKTRLLSELMHIRKVGYARDEEETIPGLSCIAVAIASSHVDGGYVAISISASQEILSAEHKLKIKSTLDGIVLELRRRL